MPSSELRVSPVVVEELHAIRRRVLRGDDPEKKVEDPRDHDETALHLAVFDGEDLVAGGSFYPSSPPVSDTLESYQLRYLATETSSQRHGAGRLLLRFAESELSSLGVEQLWANGRDTALGFYERVGWRRVPGSEHLSGETQLPHTVIYKVLRRTDPVTFGWAGSADAAVLADLREEMIFSVSPRSVDPSWKVAAVGYFDRELAAETLLCAVARTRDGEIVALAAASLRAHPPSPWSTSGRTAYIHSVSTRPAFRRRGLSRALVTQLLDELRSRGVGRAELHATDQGEHLYRDLGFAEPAYAPELRLSLG